MKRNHARAGLALAVTASLALVVTAPTADAAQHGPVRIAPSRGDRGSVDTVVASFDHIAPRFRAEFQAAAQKEAYLSLRREPGTLSYHIVPDPSDATRFFFVATFTDAAAYASHRADFPAKDFLRLVAKDGIDGPVIIIDNTSVPNEVS